MAEATLRPAASPSTFGPKFGNFAIMMTPSFRQFLFCAGMLLFQACTLQAQYPALKEVGHFPAELRESSGLTWAGGALYSLSDDKLPEFYRIDTATARIIQTITMRGLTFSDKESMTSDGTYLYIGDFGNNKGHRRDLKIVKVRIADIGSGERVEVDGEVIDFHYPEQQDFDGKKKDNAFDCEAMVAMGDSLYLFTKQRNDHQTTLYSVPKSPGEHAARRHGSFDVQGRITGATLSPDGKHLLLLGYGKKHQQPFLWHFSGFDGSGFFAGKAQKRTLHEGPLDWQMEAVTFVDGHTLFLSCEESDEVKAGLYRGSKLDIFK